MAADFTDLSNSILSDVGGKDNIQFLTHCVTRLRMNLKDKSKVDSKKIDGLSGVLGTQWAGDQFQVIIGPDVPEVYETVRQTAGLQKEAAVDEQLDDVPVVKKRDFSLKHILDLFLNTLTSIFAPFIPAIVACGLLQGVLYSIMAFGLVSAKSTAYVFFYTIGNTAFYFLPILVAFSAAKRFGCNQYVGAVLGAVLVHPTFVGLAGKTMHLWGIPIMMQNYSSSVVPAILCVYFMSLVEKQLKKVVPKMLDIVVTPFLSLVIAAFVGLTILAPLGDIIGSFVANGTMDLYNHFGALGGLVYAGLYPFILSTGMQVAFVPVIMQNIASMGYDVIYPFNAASNAAMAAAALFVFFRSKNVKNKSLGSSTGITALIGITEPVLFGLVLKYKKLLWSVVAGGAVGGLIMGIFRVHYNNFGFVPFGTIVLAFGPTFAYYMIGVIAAMAVTVGILLVTNWRDDE